MTYKLFLIPAFALVTACGELGGMVSSRSDGDKGTDNGRDSKHLSQ